MITQNNPQLSKVSILMPIYNVGKQEGYLSEAIHSILAQTHTNWELICINDHSLDNTADILAKYAKKDDRIKVVLNKHGKGISGALNTGIELATGQFMARHDADDISLPERLEKQLQYLQTHKDAVAVGSQLIIIDAESVEKSIKYSPTDPKVLKQMLFRYMPMPHPALMVRAEVFKKIRYNETYPTSEDVVMYFDLAKFGDFGNTSEPLYKYRITDKSNSFGKIRKSVYYTIKGRWEGSRKTGLKPDFTSLFYTLTQAVLLLFPGKLIHWLYLKLRMQKSADAVEPVAKFFELVRYGIVGVLTVFLDWASYSVLQTTFGVNYLLADIINIPVFLSFNYYAHKLFTFRNTLPTKKALPKYLLLTVFNQAEALAILAVSVNLLHLDPVAGKALQIVVMPILNFFILKLFVFKNN